MIAEGGRTPQVRRRFSIPYEFLKDSTVTNRANGRLPWRSLLQWVVTMCSVSFPGF